MGIWLLEHDGHAESCVIPTITELGCVELRHGERITYASVIPERNR